LCAYEAGRSIPSTKTLERILSAGGFKLAVALLPDDAADELRIAETLEAVLNLGDAFPRNPSGPLRFPNLAEVLTP
jgi:hypothetical protein